MGDTYFIGPERLAAMRFEQAYKDSLNWKPRPSPKPVAAVPPSFVPPANASPIVVATAFLANALASNPAPVAALMAGAAKFGIKESTLRRAKKALAIKTIERDDGFYWAFAAQAEG
jgi:hypothetical protein